MKLIAKLGTNAIFDAEKQEIKKQVLDQIAEDAQKFTSPENKLIIVSSGAVGCGKKVLPGNSKIRLKQAQAAIGQRILMDEYAQAFSKHNLQIAQFLLTYADLESPIRLQNIAETYYHLSSNKIIPIVNENDTTTTEELSFGDNDVLATELAVKLNFEKIINYTERGALLKNNQPVTSTNQFDPEFYDTLTPKGNGFGGLASKLQSANRALERGIPYVIAKAGDSIADVLSGEAISTEFYI